MYDLVLVLVTCTRTICLTLPFLNSQRKIVSSIEPDWSQLVPMAADGTSLLFQGNATQRDGRSYGTDMDYDEYDEVDLCGESQWMGHLQTLLPEKKDANAWMDRFGQCKPVWTEIITKMIQEWTRLATVHRQAYLETQEKIALGLMLLEPCKPSYFMPFDFCCAWIQRYPHSLQEKLLNQCSSLCSLEEKTYVWFGPFGMDLFGWL